MINFNVACAVAELNGPTFWRSPFNNLCESKQLAEFIVMDLEFVSEKNRKHVAGHGPESHKVSG